MNTVLHLSLTLNVLLAGLAYWLYLNYVPKRNSRAKRHIGSACWIVMHKGRLIGFYSATGEPIPLTVKGSVKIALDNCSLNKATWSSYVNWAESVEEMKAEISKRQLEAAKQNTDPEAYRKQYLGDWHAND